MAEQDQFNTLYSPELNSAILADLKKRIAMQKEQDIAAAQGRAAVRGIAGSNYEANQIASANRTATDAETNAAIQLAVQNATAAREERLIKEGRAYQTSEREAAQKYGTSEREASQGFTAGQADLQRKWQELQLQKEQAFAAGENEKARQFEAQQAELQRQLQLQLQGNSQAFEGRQNAKQRKTDIITGVAETVGNVVGIFCFTPGTLIDMADGSKKEIRSLQLNDETRGGRVTSIRIANANDLYDYLGTYVTGFHAVKVGSIWRRVYDTPWAARMDGEHTVYSIVTTGHRVFTNGIEFADEHETDDYEFLSLDQSLELLNAEEKSKAGI